MAAELSGGLQAALGELLKEEHAKEGKKKKPAFKVPVEKRLQYYSGWSRKDRKGGGVSKMDEEIGSDKKSRKNRFKKNFIEDGYRLLIAFRTPFPSPSFPLLSVLQLLSWPVWLPVLRRLGRVLLFWVSAE